MIYQKRRINIYIYMEYFKLNNKFTKEEKIQLLKLIDFIERNKNYIKDNELTITISNITNYQYNNFRKLIEITVDIDTYEGWSMFSILDYTSYVNSILTITINLVFLKYMELIKQKII